MYEELPSFYEIGLNSLHRFLLAKFNVDYIVGFRTVGAIEQALLNLSMPEVTGMATERENERQMDNVYNCIIDSIRNLPQGINRKYAFRALSWIGYATRMLTVQELLVAISVEATQYQLSDSDMLRFVIADGQAVCLVHFSVRNYLDTKSCPKIQGGCTAT